MMTAWLGALLLAAPTKYVMLPLECPKELEKNECTALETAIAADLRRYPSTQLLTHEDVKAVLKNDAARQVLGCDDPSCYPSLGQALGAPFLVRANYAQLGGSQLVSLTVIKADSVEVTSAASVRVRSPKIDDLLDALPKLGAQMFEQIGIEERTTQAMLRLPPKPAKGKKSMPEGFEDIPLDQTLPDDLVFLKDAAGNVVAFGAKDKGSDVFLAGSEGALWQQRVGSSSSNGDTSFSVGFWDPRYDRPSFNMKDGLFELVCGKKTVSLERVGVAESKKLRGRTRVFAPRWQRYPVVLARDNRGTYYYVDRVRDDEKRTGEVEDYRLFIGRKGRMDHVPLEDAIVDQAGAVFLTESGRLVFEYVNRDEKTVRWFVGEQETELVDVSIFSAAKMIYTRLGPYRDQPMGTACDPYL